MEIEEEENVVSYKVILLGDSGVGKTSIISRYFQNNFNETHIATIGVDFRYKSINIDGTVVRLQVWDTAGQERFRAISRNYYRDVDAIIVVYSVTDINTFQGVRTWLSEIDSNSAKDSRTNGEPQLVKYLVGNKADMTDKKCVEEARGLNEANTYGTKFMETSAKNGYNIEELFVNVARDLKESIPRTPAGPDNVDLNPESSKKKKGCC